MYLYHKHQAGLWKHIKRQVNFYKMTIKLPKVDLNLLKNNLYLRCIFKSFFWRNINYS